MYLVNYNEAIYRNLIEDSIKIEDAFVASSILNFN